MHGHSSPSPLNPHHVVDRCSGAQGVTFQSAFAILNAFKSDDPHMLSLAELARRTGLYKSTILRLLASLEHAWFIRKWN
jgi:DNA-binding MarR family transcriptional regulator